MPNPGRRCQSLPGLRRYAGGGPGWDRAECDPGPIFEGNAYTATDLPRVPETLGEAVEAFGGSDFPHRAFGSEIVEHLVHFARAELASYQRAVTDFERARYFERI